MDKEDGRCDIYKLPISSMDLGTTLGGTRSRRLYVVPWKRERREMDAGEKVIKS